MLDVTAYDKYRNSRSCLQKVKASMEDWKVENRRRQSIQYSNCERNLSKCIIIRTIKYSTHKRKGYTIDYKLKREDESDQVEDKETCLPWIELESQS